MAYVEANFGLEAALKLLDKTDAIVDTITTFPTAFPVSTFKPSVRRAVITKQTSLLYQIEAEEIQLLHFWDNRRGFFPV